MATGYTYPVKDGEVTELSDFALSVARGFGAFIMQRDEGPGLPRKRKVEPYYLTAVDEAMDKFEEWTNTSEEDRKAQYDEYVTKHNESNRKAKQTRNLERQRYEAMLKKVNAWDVPETLQSLKDYMIDQINMSIDHDCDSISTYYDRSAENYREWEQGQDEYVTRGVRFAKENLQKELSRVVGQNKYTEDLYTSLGLDYNKMVTE